MYDSAISVSCVILSTWSEVIATTLYGVDRVIFYGVPPPELLNLFGVWPTDVLILSTMEEHYVNDWIPFPLSRWACMEQTLHDIANPPPCDVCPVTSPVEPPSYEHAVMTAETIDLTSEDSDTDDDVFYD